MSKLITPEDILPLKEYDKLHEEHRRKIVELKTRRRITVGPFATFVFENFETVRFQIQEMVRVERLSDPEKVRFEIDTYNELMPRPGELSATLFLEIDSPEERKKVLPGLGGIEKTVVIKAGEGQTLSTAQKIENFVPEEVERPDYASAVYFLRFPFMPESRSVFLSTGKPIWITIDHPNYGASQRFSEPMVAELRRDLQS